MLVGLRVRLSSAMGRLVTTIVLSLAAVAPSAGAAHSLVGFASPSRNIGCYMDSTQVRCDIRKRDWTPPEATEMVPIGLWAGTGRDRTWARPLRMRRGHGPRSSGRPALRKFGPPRRPQVHEPEILDALRRPPHPPRLQALSRES